MSDPDPKALPGPGAAVFHALAKRVYYRSHLSDGEVSPAAFQRILECARRTPSVANRQPWMLSGCAGETAREILTTLARTPDLFLDFFASASGDEGVTSDLHNAGALVFMMGERKVPMWRDCCLLASYQLMLAANSEDLTARTLLPVSPNEMSKLIRVPEGYMVFSLILFGHMGDKSTDTRSLKSISEVSAPLHMVPEILPTQSRA